jgi:hypothetical protein
VVEGNTCLQVAQCRTQLLFNQHEKLLLHTSMLHRCIIPKRATEETAGCFCYNASQHDCSGRCCCCGYSQLLSWGVSVRKPRQSQYYWTHSPL